MSKAENALHVLKKNLQLDDLQELVKLIQGYLEEESQKGIRLIATSPEPASILKRRQKVYRCLTRPN